MRPRNNFKYIPYLTDYEYFHGQDSNRDADVVRDYLRFVLLPGLRKNEAARLRWADADLRGRTFTVADTKNREAHALPLSDYLVEILERRRAAQPKAGFVFQADGARLNDPKYQISKVQTASAVEFSLHDSRRTFATIAESLDIPYFALKQLLNHKTLCTSALNFRFWAYLRRWRRALARLSSRLIEAGYFSSHRD